MGAYDAEMGQPLGINSGAASAQSQSSPVAHRPTMRFALALLCCLVALAASASAAEKYTNRWDNIDLDAILRDDKKLDSYLACALDSGPCSREAELLKRVMPEAIRTMCERCTPRQKEGARRAMDFLKRHRPQQWARLVRKFDPTGEYTRKYEALRAQGKA